VNDNSDFVPSRDLSAHRELTLLVKIAIEKPTARSGAPGIVPQSSAAVAVSAAVTAAGKLASTCG
jgi:hypothetical protein